MEDITLYIMFRSETWNVRFFERERCGSDCRDEEI